MLKQLKIIGLVKLLQLPTT